MQAANALGVSLEGVCLYPIVDHPGWDDDRHCPNGLWGYPDDEGRRPIYEPLARELAHQQQVFEAGQPEISLDADGRGLLDIAAQEMEEVTAKSRQTEAGS